MRAALAVGVGLLAGILLTACSANDDVPAPRVSNVVPDHATAGSIVLVNGDYFCQRPATGQEDPLCDATGQVHFGASPGTPTTWTETGITVEVPQGVTGGVDLSVIAKGRASNSIRFTAD